MTFNCCNILSAFQCRFMNNVTEKKSPLVSGSVLAIEKYYTFSNVFLCFSELEPSSLDVLVHNRTTAVSEVHIDK